MQQPPTKQTIDPAPFRLSPVGAEQALARYPRPVPKIRGARSTSFHRSAGRSILYAETPTTRNEIRTINRHRIYRDPPHHTL